MIEDPLERIEREERERKEKKGPKALMIVLAVVAVGLACALGYILYRDKGIVSQLEINKAELTQEVQTLKEEYSSLSSDYESINHQLDTSREQVAQLLDRLAKTEATNLAQINKYKKELGTLRSIMKGYIVQIDSLNTLNKKLTAEASEARREAAESRRANEALTAQVSDLSEKVSTGKVLRARGIGLYGYNGSNKVSDRHSRVQYMVATVSLVENSLADSGPVRVYVRVKDPEGILLMDGTGASFTLSGEAMPATASREIDYNGKDVDVSIYVNNTGEFSKGIYTAEVFTASGRLGKAETMLR